MTVPTCADCHAVADLLAVTRLRPTRHRVLVCVNLADCLWRRSVWP